ncbi:MAG: GNAT family N-acetyltransferase [Acidimicrobiales bacterium]
MTVSHAREANQELVAALGRLLPQLSASAPVPTAAQVEEMVDSPATIVFVARDGADGPIVGTLTLAHFRTPTGVRAWIEDVVVDASVRGRGGGEALTRAAIEAAAGLGARTVELTSRPSREAANRLYQRMGFQLRETNLYRYDVPAGGRR